MDDNRNSMRVSDLDLADRPREKAIRHGVRALTNAELMAIIFGAGLPGMSVIDMSKKILAECDNSLSTLARMSISEISRKFKGVGPAKAIAISAAIELGSRCRDENATRDDPQVRSSSDAFNYIRGTVENLDHEEFWILILSRSNRIKAAVKISAGGTAATVVDVKLLMKQAVDRLAAGIIVVHNHPSGTLKPSDLDDRLTFKIKSACEIMDIRMLDHIIVAQNSYYSYLDENRL